MGKSIAIVDLSNLNVLYKRDDRFVLALTYNMNVGRLSATLAALGTGYDIFLCLKPRLEGEGDYIIKELSVSGVPFVVDSVELYKTLKFFRESSGVGSIYLCNWLYNYVCTARVKTFSSAFHYGDRVALLQVKEGLIETFKLYPTVSDFTAEVGAEFNCYGDVGLIDVDGIRARYPELMLVSKPSLTCFAPLIQCNKTSMRVETDDLFETLERKVVGGEEFPSQDSELSVDEAQSALDDIVSSSAQETKPPVEVPSKAVPQKQPLFGLGVVGACLLGVCCVLMFILGASTVITRVGAGKEYSPDYLAEAQDRLDSINTVALVYSHAETATQEFINAYEFLSGSDFEVQVTRFASEPSKYVVGCNCASEGVLNSYLEYIEQKYTVLRSYDASPIDGNASALTSYVIELK